MTFQELGLNAPILKALTEQGYETPSPIQQKAIPHALQGRDVLGCAQTGTGKTCAFATPILQRLAAEKPQGRPIRALILTPTRELALQIQESFEAYGKHLPLRSVVIFGGVSQKPQEESLRRGVDILVATPGRLGDLYQQKLLDLSKVEIFVLDEADRMLDMGFIHDVKKILQWLPEKKQTLFFSATMPPEITNLVNSLLHDPVKVAVDPVSSPVEVIDQSVYFVDRTNKSKLLAQLVKEQNVKNALVFTRTKHGANKVVGDLLKAGITAVAIHGNKSQTARQQALADFKAGTAQVLVATDIAARGIDIEELSHVFNYNLPEVPETYVHRIGRTGRAGHGGVAVAFCDFSEKPLLRDVEKLIGKKVPVVGEHNFPMTVFEVAVKDARGRLVNAEDAEARDAARDRRKERDAANKSRGTEPPHKGKERQMTQPQPKKAAAAPSAPQKRNKHLRENTPGTAPRREERGVKNDFRKPDPMAGDHVMDATARLLAPKPRPVSQNTPPENRSSNGQRKDTRAPRQDAGRKGPRTPEKAASPDKNRERRRPPMPQEPNRHTKDSTEQESLMKPFYLNRGR